MPENQRCKSESYIAEGAQSSTGFDNGFRRKGVHVDIKQGGDFAQGASSVHVLKEHGKTARTKGGDQFFAALLQRGALIIRKGVG